MANVCIICYEEKNGAAVEDDFVIKTIRGIKQRFGMAKNNRLVVCQNCMDPYKKRREKYERDLVIHVVLAALVFAAMVMLPIFTTGFSLSALILGLILSAVIIALSVFSHCPRVAIGAVSTASPGKKKEAAKKKK